LQKNNLPLERIPGLGEWIDYCLQPLDLGFERAGLRWLDGASLFQVALKVSDRAADFCQLLAEPELLDIRLVSSAFEFAAKI